ncbi:phosphoribosylformylglycinamidine cyclo-ligase [Batrachochytrium salamandrivorans]|nr:phosphoribosylformylglycinamidine cyclo-ligase [Batrachochytrium salamandrivorans]
MSLTSFVACRVFPDPEELLALLGRVALPIISLTSESSEFLSKHKLPFTKASAQTQPVGSGDVFVACLGPLELGLDIHCHSLIRMACEANAFVIVKQEDYALISPLSDRAELIAKALRYCTAFDLGVALQKPRDKYEFEPESLDFGLFRALKSCIPDYKLLGEEEDAPALFIGSSASCDLGPSSEAQASLQGFSRPEGPLLYFSDGQTLFGPAGPHPRTVFTHFTIPYKGPLVLNSQGKVEFQNEKACYSLLSKVDNLDELLYACATQSLAMVQTIKLRKVRLAVLGSTPGGSSMQPLVDALLDSKSALAQQCEIALVIADKFDAGVLKRGGDEICPDRLFVDPKSFNSRQEFDNQCVYLLKQFNIDLVVLVGYMRIVSPIFCDEAFKGRIINVHPSLLPEFAGGMDLKVHQAVLDAKRTESGCTVHLVTSTVDAGPVVRQYRCPVFPEQDTAQTLKARVQALEGPCLIDSILDFANQDGVFAEKLTYDAAGVSTQRGDELVEQIKNCCKATRRVGCDAELGGYGALFDLTKLNLKDPIIVSGTDGVGTKLMVAQKWGDHSTIGIDLVAMSVNDLIVQGAEPLVFLDYFACGKLDLNVASQVVTGIAKGCEMSGCALIGGETAEMPGMYPPNTYDLAGFAMGAVERENMLPKKINEGDVLIGITSSGIHSNGYSLVRKITEGLDLFAPPPFPSTARSLKDVILEPTKLYYKPLKRVFAGKLVEGLSHITGSGLPGNLPRVYNEDELTAEVDLDSWDPQAIFKYLSHRGQVNWEEMLSTFNCGIGMVLFVKPENVSRVLDLLPEDETRVIGKMITKSTAPVVFIGKSFLGFYRDESKTTYKSAGVDIHEGDSLVEQIKPACRKTVRAGCLHPELGGFGALFDLSAVPRKHPIMVSGTDGVGTKLLLAQDWNRHESVGVDLVAMSVNDLICQGAEPLFFLDYFACGKLDIAQASTVIQGIAYGCELSGCALVGGETAEMPGMYDQDEYDLAGFAVGVVDKDQLLPRPTQAGDLLIGLKSNGFHSNGFSLVRKALERGKVNCDMVLDAVSGERTLKDLLIEPTKVYWEMLKPFLLNEGGEAGSKIQAMAHITGSGLPGNLPRVYDESELYAEVDLKSWKPDALFSLVAKAGKIEGMEMLNTFNCGVGMVLIIKPGDLDFVMATLGAEGNLGVIGSLKQKATKQDPSVVFVNEQFFLA